MRKKILTILWIYTLGSVSGATLNSYAVATEDRLPGDANLDGHVNIADVTAVDNYLLGQMSMSFSITNADVNGDGVVDKADVSAIVCIILGIPDHSGISDGKYYVDLGLPSGTLWAACNVGADNPEDYGGHFAWGEIEGYGNNKTQFTWSTYKWCNGSAYSQTKYCVGGSYGIVDNKKELDLDDDAAYTNWGTSWCIPSKTQFDELTDSKYTTMEWTTQNGVNGRKIISKKNGNYIFLPAAGYRNNSLLSKVGSEGYYWSRSLYVDGSNYAYDLFFNSSNISADDFFYRYGGQCVRPVRIME